jgi:hypothetical protein
MRSSRLELPGHERYLWAGPRREPRALDCHLYRPEIQRGRGILGVSLQMEAVPP